MPLLLFPREGELCPPVAEDDLGSAVQWPGPSLQPTAHMAWSDRTEAQAALGMAFSLPEWSWGQEARDRDSSVSSGRLSCSSGGHESCAPAHGPWKERPPLVLGPRRQPRKSDPRLEQLRDRIRAQAQWQTSSASLGTSAPSSASRLCKASPAVRRKTRRVACALPAPAHPGFSVPSTAERRAEDKATFGRGHELSSASQRQASGDGKKVTATERPPVQTCSPRLASAHSGQQMSEDAPSVASRDRPATMQTAMAILRDLRQQVQAGLELAQGPKGVRECRHTKPCPRDPAGQRRQGPRSAPDMRGSLLKSPWTAMKGRPPLERARSFHAPRPWSTLAEWESCPRRAWVGLNQHPSFQRPGNPPTRLGHFSQKPWSASVGQPSCSRRAWAAQGQDFSFQRPGSAPEKLGPFSQRPCSALAAQAGPQRAWVGHKEDPSFQRLGSPPGKLGSFSWQPWSALPGQACLPRASGASEGWESPAPRPWSSREAVPSLARHTALAQRASTLGKGSGAVPPSSGAKLTGLRPSQSFLQSPLGKKDVRPPPPCPRPRGSLGHPYSSESLRDFMRQKALARRRQAQEDKATAARTLERRNQRLQEIYRKQKEAALSRAGPVVSQTSPGIVTFVPSSAQLGGPEAPESLAAPVPAWSKVTSGTVLGDQEVPGRWALCIYLDPREAELLGMSGPLQLQHKQALLQALESTAHALQQRIDRLTAQLHGSVAPAAAGDLDLDLPPARPSTVPARRPLTAPSCPTALVPSGGPGVPQAWVGMKARPRLFPSYFLNDELPSSSLRWERQKSESLRAPGRAGAQAAGDPVPLGGQGGPGLRTTGPGFLEEESLEQKRLQRKAAALRALGTCTGSSRGVPAILDPTCGPQQGEEVLLSGGAGMAAPWSTQTCDWAAAIRVAALDCTEERNQEVCRAYDIHFYPTFRYFRAFTKDFTAGENFKGPDRELRTVRQTMVDFLQNHTEGNRPPACPPLGPVQPRDVLSLLGRPGGHYVAVLFESGSSYLGREVTLDLIPYEGVVVSRVLDGDRALLDRLGVSSVPSCYLIHPNGSHGLVSMTRLYTADLESGLHYLLRVELAAHRSLAGAELRTLRDFVTIMAKISGILLPNHIKWVGCQGSRPELRGYPCSLWKLFHTLTVRASTHPQALAGTGFEDDPQAVLQTVRRYVRSFFGCRDCADHFEDMADASMASVKTADQAVLWLWRAHNVVSGRLAVEGPPAPAPAPCHPSEDPKFPKVPWPSPDLCPACHEEVRGLDSWSESHVLAFLKRHYSSDNLLDTYAADLGGLGGAAAPARAEGEEGLTPLAEAHGGHDAQSLRPPSALGPREHLPEGLPHRLDLGLQSPHGPRARQEAEAAVPFLGAGFSSLDMSLCVLLYVASSLFLMLMYFFFRVRSKRWKARLYHPAV
ncbi:Sulfhydryl oxidase 2 [Tupaia chinensis]|uniref:Sulfhydryl oxidase n=1 Tax=Tupaia chinensis TaxID=246437 RepID=L8YFG3_TUPCH|nr:Sulfhydryl oxidase 2 [Tupaia chinensis]